MAFDGTEGGPIALAAAGVMTKAWRLSNPTQTKAVFMGRDIIEQLLNPKNIMGIRIYFAEDATGKNTVVLAGALTNEDDVTTLVANFGNLCPSDCSAANPLNS
jgi:hypothetical protein